MPTFTSEQLRRRAFERAAWVLRHFWEEQQDDVKREARVHTRLFDPLISNGLISVGRSVNGGGHVEHLVPCALLRDQAFRIFWKAKDQNQDVSSAERTVADMLEKYLRIAYIAPFEARRLDHELGLKTTMPKRWGFETGSVFARLDEAKIVLEQSR
jgi:hypothetical protein